MENNSSEINYETFVSKKELIQTLLRIRREIDRVLPRLIIEERDEK